MQALDALVSALGISQGVARQDLHQALSPLQIAADIQACYPIEASRHTEVAELQRPPLPRWVRLPRSAGGPTPQERAAQIPWHPKLRFARRLPRLTEGELWALLRCQRFLSQMTQEEPILTARERSLRLFDDEKRLDALSRGQLFEPGRLSAGSLGAVL